MIAATWKRLRRDENGSPAIEFALIAPAFLAIVFGIINLSLFGLTFASLHYSVEEGARCQSIKKTCPNLSSYYFAPGPVPIFTSTEQSCGYKVSAAVTFTFNIVFYKSEFPLSAVACFP